MNSSAAAAILVWSALIGLSDQASAQFRAARPANPRVLRAIAVDVAVEAEAAEAEEDDDDAEEKPAGRQRAVQQEIGPEVFDQWAFLKGNEQAARDDLQSQLSMRINDIDRVCALTPPQIQKLQLAGRTDVKRLFDRVDASRRKFELQRKNQKNVNQLWQEIQPLRMSMSGRTFGDGSVFDKVARRIMTDEQLPRYRRQVQERRQFRSRAQREIFLMSLDREVPLREAQRVKLQALLDACPPVNPGQYEYYALWFVASQIPEEKYREVLSEPQWKALNLRFAQTRNMEQWLRQAGALGDKEVVD